jgi:hypothetical protein
VSRQRHRAGIGFGAIMATAVVLACAGLASGHAGHSPKPVDANLDSDPSPERVLVRDLCRAGGGTIVAKPVCGPTEVQAHRVEIEDVCGAGPRVIQLSGVVDYVLQFAVTDADADRARSEVFLDVRRGATGRGGAAGVVRLGAPGPDGCPQPKWLLRYPSRATLGARPRGAAGLASWGLNLANYKKALPGREVRIAETYVDRDDPYCCPSFMRFSYFRFERRKDRYVRFATRVKRIKRR